MTTDQYPYTARKGACRSQQGIARVKDYHRVQSGSVKQHKAAIEQGVLSIALAAGSSAFQLYRSGILNSSACGTEVNHAVGMVGYGNQDGTDYWIVRNTWGSSWGDGGYIKIAAVEGTGICASQSYSFIVNVI